MKITDDYLGKYRLWARDPQVVPLPPAPRLAKFSSRKFATHQEMNEWKKGVIQELARQTAAKWTN